MKFAHVDGTRREAMPGLAGTCPCCDSPVIPKCGEVRVHHWSHQRALACDHWWENETEWHRNWKGQFPEQWQEFVNRADDGEKHVADVRTDFGWVIEFQHSYLTPEERRSRDAFYKKLVWVVDATRRKTDADQFRKALAASTAIGPFLRRVHLDECRLLREWAGSSAPVYFDFGPGPTLWSLLARRGDEPAYVSPFGRDDFIACHHGKGTGGARDFDEFTKVIDEVVASCNTQLRSQAMRPVAAGFHQHMARRRFRRM